MPGFQPSSATGEIDEGDVASFVCRADEPLWCGVETAMDNGFGLVFVTDEDGRLAGRTDLDAMRAALRRGAHLDHVRMGDFAQRFEPSEDDAVALRLDPAGRPRSVLVNGGARFLPVAEPDLSRAELRNVIDAFLSTWISSTGDYIRTFETTFADRLGMGYGVATANGTVSLHLALVALGIGEGDEVIVPDLTFAASANAVIHAGARPVIVDVDRDTWCISLEAVEAAITPRTRAVMPVHVFGRPAPMTEIRKLARARGLFVIEDCAEAHGATYDGLPVGSFSDVASFSFFANKIITTGEGGICVTDDPDLATRMRVLRDHGMRPERRYWHEEVGFNYRMTNLQAAIGCAQLGRMDELLAMRRRVHEFYETAMGGIPDLVFPPPMSRRHGSVTWFSCALVPSAARPGLIAACRDSNIDLRPFFNALSAMPAYEAYGAHCPVSAALSACGINLPTSRKVDGRVAERLATVFRSVLGEREQHGTAVAGALT